MFYTYRQNNSGGSFTGPALYVIVEAKNQNYADFIAENELGVYFNGIEQGLDCDCCGDRWDSSWDGGKEVPSIYSSSLAKYKKEAKSYNSRMYENIPFVIVLYTNGG